MIIEARADRELFRRAVALFRRVEEGDRFLDALGTVSYVAVDGGEVIGWCWGQNLIRPDGASMLYLHELEVAEPVRRRGFGRSLVLAFIGEGRRLGATKMFLTTGQANAPARGLYESLGGGLAAQGPTVSYWLPITTLE